jgi:hypothetical protein
MAGFLGRAGQELDGGTQGQFILASAMRRQPVERPRSFCSLLVWGRREGTWEATKGVARKRVQIRGGQATR